MIKLDKDRYLLSKGKYSSWIGIDNRYWLRVVKERRFLRKPRYKIEIITNKTDFESQEDAEGFAKHILWCFAELIKTDGMANFQSRFAESDGPFIGICADLEHYLLEPDAIKIMEDYFGYGPGSPEWGDQHRTSCEELSDTIRFFKEHSHV